MLFGHCRSSRNGLVSSDALTKNVTIWCFKLCPRVQTRAVHVDTFAHTLQLYIQWTMLYVLTHLVPLQITQAHTRRGAGRSAYKYRGVLPESC